MGGNVVDRLTFDRDARSTDPDQNRHRQARFRQGWLKAANGEEYDYVSLKELTWDNLGYRLGKLFGETTDEVIEQQYEWCVRQQRGTS